MITLFLDTSNTKLIVGIYKNDTLIYKEEKDNLNDLSSKVLPLIKEVLLKSNLSINSINKIIVVNGPGSFTGTRVGVTIAKTMAWAKKIDINTVSELELISTTCVDTDYVVPVIDARRDFYYAGIYDKNGNSIMSDIYISKEELIKKINELSLENRVTFVSYDDILYFNIVKPSLNINKIIEKYMNNISLNPHSVNPNYLKRVEAEEKLNDKRD